jgi:1-deoxy-D-xylulose-5-phosphate reductoisomerase
MARVARMSVQLDRRGVVVLGSTGSIGRSTLDVLAALHDQFAVVALAAGRDRALLQQQIAQFKPQYASLAAGGPPFDGVTTVDSPEPLIELATLPEAEIIVVATSGHAAIRATLAALEAGKIVALANKETIVAAGEIVMPVAHTATGELRPVDSEHSAIWQALECISFDPARVKRIVLTASGGPFRGWSLEQMRAVTREQALAHPNWSMGTKITIDSATLMNKGFEIIEAVWLFDCPLDRIDVVIHPQSIVHSLVEYVDGSYVAQMGSHDMRIPIQYALTYPERAPGPGTRLDLVTLGRMDFEPPDEDAFPALALARQAISAGMTYPTVLSTADSATVAAFLDGQIGFTDITSIAAAALDAHQPERGPLTLDQVAAADAWTERYVNRLLAETHS